jgi:hypothetical protein
MLDSNHNSKSSQFDPQRVGFVVVLGLHSSGSSCLAMVLHHLGVYMGDSFAYRPTSGEAVGIAAICENAMVRFGNRIAISQDQLVDQLEHWITSHKLEAVASGKIAGCKYPTLCIMGPYLNSICGGKLQVLHISRPIEESIESLSKRPDVLQEEIDMTQIETHQRWLAKEKFDFLNSLAPSQILEVEFAKFISDTRSEIERITEFLPISPSAGQIFNAYQSVDPNLKHI